jgi:hypothetical protein
MIKLAAIDNAFSTWVPGLGPARGFAIKKIRPGGSVLGSGSGVACLGHLSLINALEAQLRLLLPCA